MKFENFFKNKILLMESLKNLKTKKSFSEQKNILPKSLVNKKNKFKSFFG